MRKKKAVEIKVFHEHRTNLKNWIILNEESVYKGASEHTKGKWESPILCEKWLKNERVIEFKRQMEYGGLTDASSDRSIDFRFPI